MRLAALSTSCTTLTSGSRLVGEISFDGFRRSLDVGLTSYCYAIKCALAPMLEQQHGSIINTASVSVLAGDYGLSACNALKAGAVDLPRVTSIECVRKGIRCNAVCPGPIGTPTIARLRDQAPETWQAIHNVIPMGRYGQAQEIADVALFLAPDECSFVSGVHVVHDGGLWAHSGMSPMGGVGPVC